MAGLNDLGVMFDYAGYFVSKGDWIHPQRVEETYELIVVTHGEVHMKDGVAGEVCLTPGQVLLLEPGVPHGGTQYSSKVRFYWLHFRYPEGKLPFSQRYFPHFEQMHLFREILHVSNLPKTPSYVTNASLVYLLSALGLLAERSMSYDPRAEQMLEWIRINATASLRREDAAEHFCCSPDHLSRLLHATYGCGFKELVDRFIMAQAHSLLCNTTQYVKEIAAALDFPSDKAFISFFRYHEGIYPEQFRRRYFKTHLNNR